MNHPLAVGFLLLLAVPALMTCLYLLVLTLLSAATRRPTEGGQQLRFDIVVPAHNEAAVITRCVRSLQQLNWPRDSFRILVIADNCNDRTAALAHAAGAHVIEREHAAMRGKGYALEHAFRLSGDEAWADAVVVVDADSEVSSNLLAACATRIESGAHAVQVHYGVLDAQASWRTRLMAIALGAFHRLRSRARERLKLSCGLRGNGWCVSHALLAHVPYRAFSLAEDIEYGIELGLVGLRVHYADEAWVNAEMVSDSTAAGTQRRRWESGRMQLIKMRTRVLFLGAWHQRSAVNLDLAIDLLIPPLAYVAVNVAGLAVFAALLFARDLVAIEWLWLSVGCVGVLAAYVLRGWQLSGVGAQGLLDLARAPLFVLWKLWVMLQPTETEWVRTRRRTS